MLMLFSSWAVAQEARSGQYTPPSKIRYCIDPNWHPYESLKQNTHTGISSELMALFTAHTGIETELIITQSWLETIELLKNDLCDLTPALNRTDEREQFLSFSEIWYRSPNVLISLQDEPFLQGLENLKNRTVALTEGYRISDYIFEHYPEIIATPVSSEIAGINAVINHEVDVFIGSMLSINNYIQSNGFDEIKIAGWAGPEDLLRVGVTTKNQALIPIINQFINQISEAERIQMFRKWNNVSYIDNTNYKLIKNITLIFSALLIAGLLYSLLVRKLNVKLTLQNQQLENLKTKLIKTNQELLFLTHHDLLTELYNRHYFNQVITADNNDFEVMTPLSVVFFDIDHFKSINDIYGHATGDEALRSIAKTITSLLDHRHTFVRWGGEEFIILCKETNKLEANLLCQNLTNHIRQIKIHPKVSITCSYGIAERKPEESIMMCIERADQAMYQAKTDGRDRINAAL